MKRRTALLAAALGLASLFTSAQAFSQGCTMCYTSAAGASKDGQRAISRGVLILLIPSLSFMSLGVVLAFRYSRRRDLERNQHPHTSLGAEL